MATEHETLIVDIGGNATKRLRDIERALESSKKSWGANAQVVNRFRAEMNEMTDQFKAFGLRGNAIATMLEEMPDPVARANLAQKLLAKEVARSGTLFGKLSSKLAESKAKLSAIPGGLTAVTAGFAAVAGVILGATAALVAFAKEGVKKAVEASDEASAALEGLELSYDNLQVAVGEAIVGADAGAGAMASIGASIDDLSASVRGNSNEMGSAMATVVEVVKILGAVLVTTTTIGMAPFALAIDALVLAGSTMAKGFLGLRLVIAKLTGNVVELLHQLGLVETEGLEAVRKQIKKADKDFDDFEITTAGATETLWDLNEVVWSASKAQADHNTKLSRGEKILADFNAELGEQLRINAMLNNLGPEELDRLRLIGESTRQLAEANEARTKYLKGEADAERKSTTGKAAAAAATWDYAAASQRLFENMKAAWELRQQAAAQEALEAERQENLNAALERANLEYKAQAKLSAQVADNQTWTSFGDTMMNFVAPSIDNVTNSLTTMFFEMARGQATMKDFGNGIATLMGSLVGQLAPAFTQLGVALIATQTGNALGLIAAGVALTSIAAMLGSLGKSEGGGSKGSSSTGASAIRDIAREFRAGERETTAEERAIVINIGTREIFRTIDDGRRRGQIGGNA